MELKVGDEVIYEGVRYKITDEYYKFRDNPKRFVIKSEYQVFYYISEHDLRAVYNIYAGLRDWLNCN